MENGAGNEVRTRDLYLGKVSLCQLSYSRVCIWKLLCPAVAAILGLQNKETELFPQLNVKV
jgi:hypothetical protein